MNNIKHIFLIFILTFIVACGDSDDKNGKVSTKEDNIVSPPSSADMPSSPPPPALSKEEIAKVQQETLKTLYKDKENLIVKERTDANLEMAKNLTPPELSANQKLNKYLSRAVSNKDSKRVAYVKENGLPGEYASIKSSSDDATREELGIGSKIFQRNCAMCHGKSAMGDGPAGKSLKPRASNLNLMIKNNMIDHNGYLYWAISEGGRELKTSMPAFKKKLKPEERWALVKYLRATYK